MEGLFLHAGAQKIGRQDLLALPTPEATDTHTTIAHSRFVEATLEALAFRRIEVVKDEYGISKDAMKLFGVMTLNIQRNGVNLTLGLRNSNDKSFSLGMVAGFRVFCCDNLAFQGEFFALAKKHSKKLMDGFQDSIAIGVDRTQRHFSPMMEKINVWKNHELPDVNAKALILDAFVREEIAPTHLLKHVNEAYFNPPHPEFEPRNLWSLQNSFTEAFKLLDPIPMYRATSALGTYFEALT